MAVEERARGRGRPPRGAASSRSSGRSLTTAPASGSGRSSTRSRPTRTATGHLLRVAAQVGCARRSARPARRPGWRCCRRPGRPGRRCRPGATTSVSSCSAPWIARASGESAKAAYETASPIERDPRCIVGVAVEVRVDGALEAGDQLVGARVDGRAAGDCRGCQPATRIGSTDAPGAIPLAPPGPPAPTRIPAISVPCRSSRLEPSGSRRCARVGVVADEVDPRQDAAAQVRVGAVDAGVEQRDRHAAAVVARQPQRRQAARPRARRPCRRAGRGDGRRVGGRTG